VIVLSQLIPPIKPIVFILSLLFYLKFMGPAENQSLEEPFSSDFLCKKRVFCLIKLFIKKSACRKLRYTGKLIFFGKLKLTKSRK